MGGPHTHPDPQAYSHTQSAMQSLQSLSRAPASLAQPANAQRRARKASLGSGLGLLRNRALPFSSSLPGFSPSLFSLPPSTLPSSSHPLSFHPFSPAPPPPAQRHRSCYWGSLERGAIPSPKRLAKTSGAQQQAPIAGPKRSF